MKPLTILLALFPLVATVEAKDSSSDKNAQKQKQKEKEKEQAQKKEARDKKRDAVKTVLDAKDTNHDGSLTKEEFITGESDAEEAAKRFDQYNKNGDRYLTKGEIEVMLGL